MLFLSNSIYLQIIRNKNFFNSFYSLYLLALYYPKRSNFSPRLKKNQPYIVRINEDANLRYYSDESPSNSFVTDQISNPTPKIM